MSPIKARVLIVDDEPDVREQFKLYLESREYAADVAGNCLEALRRLKAGKYDLVLTDYNMPEMNGMDLLREIKQHNRDLPVVMMSGKAGMRVAVEALKEDAFDFLEKPVKSQTLIETIEKALNRGSGDVPREESTFYGPLRHSREGENQSVSVLEIYRSLDEYSKPQLQKAFHSLMTEKGLRRQVLFVLKHVSYINNVGLNFLVDMHSDFEHQGHSVLFTHLSDPVQKYLNMLGYTDFFPIVHNYHDALARLERFRDAGSQIGATM